MIRRLVTAIATVAAALFATPTFAGNIALTGHDSDFHCTFGSALACSQINTLVTFVRSGAPNTTLPVLTFDQGTELTGALTSVGIPWVNVSTVAGVGTASFDTTLYSAFAVASDSDCGGCDNSDAFVAAIAARLADITTFFNAGGGIFGLSADGNPNYYNFVPQSSSSIGGAPSSGYVASSCFGITPTAVNGDATHNHFSEPGTGGVSSLYCVAERNPTGLPAGQNAMTLMLQGGTIVTSVITTTSGGTAEVPEPATLSLVGLGLAAAYRRRRRS